ncbi:MAG: hypothetical protein Q4D03_03510 [Bacteroidales bacterium]|nr:hypothetical protein [Bacteroidales bacterium]
MKTRCAIFIGMLLMVATACPVWGQDYRVVNAKGRVVKQIVETESYSSGNDMNRQSTYFFDQQGTIDRIEKRSPLSPNPMVEKVERDSYPTKGVSRNNREEHRFDGTVDSVFSIERHQLVSIRIYDGDCDLVELHSYGSDGLIYNSIFHVYRQPGVLLYSRLYYYQKGRMTTRKEYRYNRQGLLTQSLQYSMIEGDYLVLQERLSYDKQQRVVKKVKTHYNIEDNSTRTTTERNKYTYDRQGNWTQRLYYYDGQLLSTTTRTITYW